MSKKPKVARKPETTGAWSEKAVRVLTERYLLKDDQGTPVETPDEAMYRVARAVAMAEANYANGNELYAAEYVEEWTARFYDLLVSRKFMPNSPTLMNAGKGNNLQLSACFVLPVEDSLDGIFDALKNAAIVHKSGGGTGFSFSRLRPKNARVGSTKGVSSGPVSFMKIFDAATEHIKQGGSRRGANMGILSVDHPDILEFINCKRSGGIVNFNISVGITDTFMKALSEGGDYDLIDPSNGRTVERIAARRVMDEIVDAAWATGDPGLIFLDRVNRSPANPTPDLEPIEASNPCGEQPLGPFDACNLGSINLGLFVKSDVKVPHAGAAVEAIDWDALGVAVMEATRFLDDVIDINPFPLKQISEKVRANRRIGLGIMGWADMLFKLGLRYDSDDAVALGKQVMAFVQNYADRTSGQLAVERKPFPNFKVSRYAEMEPLRNSNRTTVAPTGTISIIADCSSGIEPLFALAFQHRVKQPDGSYRVLDFVEPQFQAALDKAVHPGDAHDAVLAHVKQHGSLAGLDWEHLHGWGQPIPRELHAFVTAQEIAPEWHISMQAAFQKSVDSAISKTVNLANSATREDVETSYLRAWDLDCLGITVFRDGCKGEQVLNVGVAKPAETPAPKTEEVEAPPTWEARERELLERIDYLQAKLKRKYVDGVAKARPAVVRGSTRQVVAPEGKVNVTLNRDDDGLFEAFVNVGRAGSDIAALAEAIGRLISLNLRLDSVVPADVRAEEIARQLEHIGGSTSVGFGKNRVRSLPDAVAKALRDELGQHEAVERGQREMREWTLHQMSLAAANVTPLFLGDLPTDTPAKDKGDAPQVKLGGLCPGCGSYSLVYVEGCKKCAFECGYSAC